MSHSTQYLYGIDPKLLTILLYEEAIKLKIQGARKLLKDYLLIPHYTKRDTARISAVYKAIKFNESLLSELQC